MRIGHLNVGGIERNMGFLIDLIRREQYDIFCLSETMQCTQEFWQYFRFLTGWKVFSCSRERELSSTGTTPKVSGGVAIINCCPGRITMRLAAENPRGMLSADVSCKHSTFKPVLVTVAYLAPAGSRFQVHNCEIIASLSALQSKAAAEYSGETLLLGDFNARLGRTTPSGACRASADRTRQHLSCPSLVPFLRAHGLSPLMGRDPMFPAPFTSRAICKGTGMSEVDYIFAADDLDSQRYTILPPGEWSSYPSNCNLTHRCVGIALSLLPNSGPHIPPAEAAVEAPRWASPVYGDEQWGEVAHSTARALDKASGVISSPLSTAAESYQAFLDALASALDESLPPKRAPRAQLPESGSSPSLSSAAATQRIRAVSCRPQLPPAIVALLKHSKSLQSQHLRNLRAGRECGELRTRAALAHKAASRALRKHNKHMTDVMALKFMSLRREDAHKFFKELDSKLAPEAAHLHTDLNSNIPDEPGHPPAQERFPAHFSKLLSARSPLPPGATSPEWLQHVPAHATEHALGRRVTVAELMQLLFPLRPKVATICPATGTCNRACALCGDKEFVRMAWRGREDLLNEAPRASPTFQTSKAYSGEPAFHARHIRWARPIPFKERVPYRKVICTHMAAVLNKVLSEQRMPPGTTDYSYAAIFKAVKPGATVNRADPDGYRTVAVSKLFTRIIGLLISARLTHWTQLHDIVPVWHQGAFIPLVGSDWHVWTTLEAIKAEWRCNRDVYLLFIDFKKAYDMVHPEALFIILKRTGVPDNLIGLLRHWSESRTAQLNINGFTCPGFPVTMGTGQGDTPSCILFDIFIASLGRYLETIPGIGIQPAGVDLKTLLFADDGEVFCYSPEAVHRAALAVYRWGKAWGLELGVDMLKSAIMACLCPASLRKGAQRPALIPVQLPDGRIVPYTDSYKYLGLRLLNTLKLDHMVSALRGRMMSNFKRYFSYNSVLASADPTSRTQVFMSMVVGSINFLLNMLPVTAAVMHEIDATIKAAAREFLGLPYGAPSMLIMLESGLPTARELLVRARYQLLYALALTPHVTAPGPSLLRALMQQDLFHTLRTPLASWAHETAALFSLEASRGVVFPNTTHRSHASTHSGAVARQSGYAALQEAAIAAGLSAHVTMSDQRPSASATPKQHFYELCFSFSTPPSALGLSSKTTSLSCHAPSSAGCSLSLVSQRCNPGHISALANARLGALSLHLEPLAPASWLLPQDASPAARSSAARGTQCPFCPGRGADVWHILNDCDHPEVTAARKELHARAATYLPILASRISAAADDYQCGKEVEGLAKACKKALLDLDLSIGSSAFLLFRLCMALPWPAHCVPPGAPSPISLFGELFDAAIVPPDRLRYIYNSWTPWAALNTLTMVQTWSSAVDALSGWPPLGYRRARLTSEALETLPPRYAFFPKPGE